MESFVKSLPDGKTAVTSQHDYFVGSQGSSHFIGHFWSARWKLFPNDRNFFKKIGGFIIDWDQFFTRERESNSGARVTMNNSKSWSLFVNSPVDDQFGRSQGYGRVI